MRLLTFFCLAFVILSVKNYSFSNEKKANNLNIIPIPSEMKSNGEKFILTKNMAVSVNDIALEPVVKYFAERVKFAGKINLPTGKAPKYSNISFNLVDDVSLGDEGYTLYVNKNKIACTANKPAGIFYGIQSILQLMPTEVFSKEEKKTKLFVNGAVIRDVPRFKYRGMHLDVCRHFMPAEFVKKYIDNLAMHKINTFHWHLTEDQGWRIEIKKYPKLTEISAFRKETVAGHMSTKPIVYDGVQHGGFYTQEQIKEIVKYAQERFVTIIPEIEMPGHSVAALAAYPELACINKPYEVWTRWGVNPDVFCAGKDTTFKFLEDVLTEVMELFPSKFIHIGGDECPKDRWKTCPDCQARIKAEGLKDEHELQSYFIKRIEKFVVAKGKNIIGWDEILEGGLAPDATVMSWRGTQGGIEAAKQKHNVIMTPNGFCYLDHYQGAKEIEPIAIGGFNPISKTYSYEPVPAELTAEEAKFILGAQGNVWTEYMKTPDKVEYMALPRMAALAEVLWSKPENKNWDKFFVRLEAQFERYTAAGINFSKAVYDVKTAKVENDQNKIQLITEVPGSKIKFTLDGSEPDCCSNIYSDPIDKVRGATLKAAVFVNGQKAGSILEILFN